MNRNLDTARWPDIAPGHATVAVPVGAFEQHGPHLPLDTDTRIATAVTGALPDVVTAPAVAYGASGEHEAFAGTVSIGAEVMESLLVEYGRSVCRWAARVAGTVPASSLSDRSPRFLEPIRSRTLVS